MVVVVVFFTIFFLFYMDLVLTAAVAAVDDWAGTLTGDEEGKATYVTYFLGKGLALLAVLCGVLAWTRIPENHLNKRMMDSLTSDNALLKRQTTKSLRLSR